MGSERWNAARLALRPASPYLALAALPLLLLLANDSWIWDSPSYRDTSVYVGFFRHYLEQVPPYTANYKSSRLPFLLPGVLLYRWLPPQLAHHVLFLAFSTAGAFALFVWARRRYGAHAAFAAAAAMSVFTFSHTAPSYHNQAAVAYFVGAMALVDVPERLPAARRAILAGAAFALAVNTDFIVAMLAPAFALRLATAAPSVVEAGEVRPPLPRLAERAGAALLGAVLAMAALGAVNVVLGGRFFFFLEQVHFSLQDAKAKDVSSVPLLGFATHISSFPWLVLPVIAVVATIARLVARRGSREAVDAACLLLSLAAAAALQVRGLAILEMPHLFHPFFAPVFMALAGLIGEDHREGKGPDAAFVAAVAALMLLPLCLLGAPLSRWILKLGSAWPAAAHGVPISLGLAAAAGAIMRWLPLPRRARMIPAAGAFGIVNGLSPAPSQPAYLYQVGDGCSFRREAFRALIGADESLSSFDPRNEARWLYGAVASNDTAFDGRGWCTLVPVDAAARDLLLTHYFYTSAEAVHGYTPPARPTKLVVVARDAERVDTLVAGFLREQPSGTTVTMTFERMFGVSTSSIVLRGYDVAHPHGE